MAAAAWLSLKGETVGDIKSASGVEGLDEYIRVINAEHLIESPRDIATGRATGRRRHLPLRLVAAINKETPIIAQSLCNNENITEFRIRWTAPNPTGDMVHVATTELVNARIVNIRILNHFTLEDRWKKYPGVYEMEVVYQRITWTWEEGGISAYDDWKNPTV